MKHCGTQKLETVRLVLRRLTMQDADAVYSNWASDPEVTRFLTWPAHPDLETTRKVLSDWISRYMKNYTFCDILLFFVRLCHR